MSQSKSTIALGHTARSPGRSERAQTLTERTYRDIRLAMLHGQLERDEWYSENWLASALGVSRTPAREALRQLEAEGLVEVVPQRGFRLRHISTAELQEFYLLREMLEVYVVRTLSSRIDERTLRGLAHLLELQCLAVDDVNEFITLDEEFHLAMAEAAGLIRTARIVRSLRGVLWLLGVQVVFYPERRVKVIEEHRAVLEALSVGDGDAAAAAISLHLRRTAEAAISHLSESGPE